MQKEIRRCGECKANADIEKGIGSNDTGEYRYTIQKIDHIVITTADPKACLHFYQKLGFNTRDTGGRFELYAGDFKINVHIKGHELSPHAAHVQTGSADLCFEIKGSLGKLKSELEAKGLVIELGMIERFGRNGRMQSVYLRDPDGNLVEFCSYE